MVGKSSGEALPTHACRVAAFLQSAAVARPLFTRSRLPKPLKISQLFPGRLSIRSFLKVAIMTTMNDTALVHVRGRLSRFSGAEWAGRRRYEDRRKSQLATPPRPSRAYHPTTPQ